MDASKIRRVGGWQLNMLGKVEGSWTQVLIELLLDLVSPRECVCALASERMSTAMFLDMSLLKFDEISSRTELFEGCPPPSTFVGPLFVES